MSALFVDTSLQAAPANVADDADDDGDVQIAVPAGASSKRSPPGAEVEKERSVPAVPQADAGVIPDGGWSIPPIPWQARLALDHDRTRIDYGSWFATTTTRLSANASSYVLAPWFLRLNGASSFSTSNSTNGAESDSANGSLNASVLPRSRFPAAVAVGVGSSSTSGPGGTSRGEFKSLSWGQQYIPTDAAYTSNLNYNWNTFGQAGAGATTSQSLNGTAQIRMPGEAPQTLSISGAFNTTKSDASAVGSSLQSLNANHSIYLEDYVLTVTSDAAVNRNLIKGEGGGENSFLTAGSQMDWIPSDDYPLRLQGAARHQTFRNAPANGATTEIDSTSLNLSASYPYSRNWAYSGAGTVVRNKAASDEVTSYVFSASANWSGDGVMRQLDAWAYALTYQSTATAEYSGSTASQSSARSPTTGSVSGGIDQRFARAFAAEPKDGYSSLSLSQGLNVTRRIGDVADAANAQLSHGATYSWTRAPQPDSTMSASLSARDGRSFGASRTQYQELSGSIMGSHRLNPRELVSWNGALPISRQAAEQGAGSWQGSMNGGATYSNGRFANVTGLLYGASYAVNLRPKEDFGEQKHSGVAVDQQFTQSWSWKLGLLAWKATNDIARKADGKVSAAIRLTISREFGGVL